MARGKWAGPDWLTCISEHINQQREDIECMDDDELRDESYRLEVTCGPTTHNDRDWRGYRRLIRQEMHYRDLETPEEEELPF